MKLSELVHQLQMLQQSPNVDPECAVEFEGERYKVEMIALESHEENALQIRLYLEGQPTIV